VLVQWCRMNGGNGAGYGALQSVRGGAADRHVHTAALAFEPSRSRGRLVAVGSALVATVLAVTVLALASTGPPSAGQATALPGASLAPINPSALLSLPGPILHCFCPALLARPGLNLICCVRDDAASAACCCRLVQLPCLNRVSGAARATTLAGESGLSPVVNPFPNIRYNVFAPKEFPEKPHHRSVTKPCMACTVPLPSPAVNLPATDHVRRMILQLERHETPGGGSSACITGE